MKLLGNMMSRAGRPREKRPKSQRFRRPGSTWSYEHERTFECRRCGNDLEKFIVGVRRGVRFIERGNIKGVCTKCGHRNEYYIKRGRAPGEYSTGCTKYKQANHRHKRRRRKVRRMCNRILFAVITAAKLTTKGEAP